MRNLLINISVVIFFTACSSADKIDFDTKCFDCFSVEDPYNNRVNCKDTITDQTKYSVCYGVEGELVNDNYGVAVYSYKYDSLGRLIEVEYFNQDKTKTQNFKGVSLIRYDYKGDEQPIELKYDLDGELIE